MDQRWLSLMVLLTALYVLIDDHLILPGRCGAGLAGEAVRCGLVCLAVVQSLLGREGEHHWLWLCYVRLGHLFPTCPDHPGYHKRLKAAAPLLATVLDYLARECPS